MTYRITFSESILTCYLIYVSVFYGFIDNPLRFGASGRDGLGQFGSHDASPRHHLKFLTFKPNTHLHCITTKTHTYVWDQNRN